MNQPREQLFNQALLCFTMGIPWVFNPTKIEFNQEDWHELVSFFVQNKILNAPYPNDYQTFAVDVTVGIESQKVIKYVGMIKASSIALFHHIIFHRPEKDEQPKPSERAKPILP